MYVQKEEGQRRKVDSNVSGQSTPSVCTRTEIIGWDENKSNPGRSDDM